MAGFTSVYDGPRDTAYEAAIEFIQKRGYEIVSTSPEIGLVRFHVKALPPLPIVLRIRETDDGKLAINIVNDPATVLDLGKSREVAGKLFSDLDGILGTGTVVEGSFLAKEASFLSVLMFFVIALPVIFLLLFLIWYFL